MHNMFCKYPLWEVASDLTAVALGKKPAETVIRGAKLVNVCTHEIQENMDVAIAYGRIALVGDASHCIGEGTKVIEANGCYIAPGFLDGHIHVESSMMSVSEYARAVVPHGTVGIYTDPHEICNVAGKDGVRIMIEDSHRVPLKSMFVAPSCIPAVAGFEDTGASIDANDIREMMEWKEIVGLGEMMNFPGVLNQDANVHAELAETLKSDKIITGHYSIPETGSGLNAYIAAGINNCHESTRKEDALEKMRHGMYALLREGSAWRDLHEVAKAVTENEVDTRFACIISDDSHPETLLGNGHLDYLIRRAIEEGIDPITAIQMVTINPATSYRMNHELGCIAPSKCADIVFIDDLTKMNITRVIIDGDVVAENGRFLPEIPKMEYPDYITNTMNVGFDITEDLFKIAAPEGSGDKVKARVIEAVPAKTYNFERIEELDVKDGFVESDIGKDIDKIFVFERHHATGRYSYGFIKGFGLKRGAMAQTVAHDAHNLLVTGTNDADMALAANTLIQCGGGMCAVADGKVLGLLPLPIAGLMNDKPAEEMMALVENLGKAWKEIGCEIVSPFMTMGLASLACLPELRLTNQGLVDCRTFQFVDLFVK